MTIYKILHVPTGLYYKPISNMSRSNLSKRGKLYIKEPEIKTKYYHPDDTTTLRDVFPGEFLIKEIQMEVKEVG